jgi:hypothetical protein
VKVGQLERTCNARKRRQRTWQGRSYLENSAANTSQHFLRTQVFYSIPFEVLDAVPQVSVLGSFIYDVFINEICSSMKHSKYFSFVYIKIVVTVSSATDCTLLHSDIGSIRG